MDSECRAIIEAISVLSSDNDKEACSTISAAEEYLNGLLYDRQNFKRSHIAICTKILELTCQLPYQYLSRLIHVGASSEVINTLCTCLTTSSLQGSYAIQKLVKEFCSLRLTDMLWSGQADEQTLNNLINMPQMIGNRLQLDLDEFFIPKAFYATLIAIVCEVLARCHTAISTGSHDCSLVHISHLVSKVATSGYHGVLDHMITYLDTATAKDMIWQRISCALITQLSVYAVDKFVECVLLNTTPSLISSSGTCRILGNSLQTQRRLSHTLCHKCLLVQSYDKPWLLYNITGYLLSSVPGKQLMHKTLLSLLKVWSDNSLIRHLDYPHLVHISRAIVLFTCCLSDNNFLTSEISSEIFRQLLQGIEHHITNPMVDQRLVALRLAECVSQKVNKDGSPLKFDINENDETTLLSTMCIPITEQEKRLHGKVDHVIQPADDVTPPVDHVIQSKIPVNVHTSDDDDDDDLVPFDTAPQHSRNLPRYLREAILGIVEGSSSDQLELIKAIPNLIKSQPHDLNEVCDELCKVLLHLVGSNEDSKQMTKEALVTLLCNCPVQATTYLIGQFHGHGYSIEQRLFILEILSVSSQQLSNLHDLKGANQFIPVAGHFFFPLMKYFNQSDKDDLIVAHVIHTLAHVIHCAAVATISNKMSEHLLELVLDYRSHPNAFIRQSTLCSIAIILSIMSTLKCPVLIKEWLQDVINNDNDHHCRSLATEAIKLL